MGTPIEEHGPRVRRTPPMVDDDPVVQWLLQGDPAIRWQVLGDLLDAPQVEVAAERARVEHEGWGARLLALRAAGGQCPDGACFPVPRRSPRPPRGAWPPVSHPRPSRHPMWKRPRRQPADVDPAVQRLVGDQMPDGGWNCWAQARPAPGSFASTLEVVDALLRWERHTGS